MAACEATRLARHRSERNARKALAAATFGRGGAGAQIQSCEHCAGWHVTWRSTKGKS